MRSCDQGLGQPDSLLLVAARVFPDGRRIKVLIGDIPSIGKSVPSGRILRRFLRSLYMYARLIRPRPSFAAQYMSEVACVGWTDGITEDSAYS